MDLDKKLVALAGVLKEREQEEMFIEGFSDAAVLFPLLRTASGLEILFTVRSSKLRAHAGQIAFPGGRLDDGEDTIQAARRETFEEIGVEVPEDAVLGFLDEHPSPAKYIVTPVVAVIDWQQSMTLSEAEVEEVFTVPLERLLSLEPRFEERNLQHYKRRLHFYEVDQYVIWGLTGNLLKNLLDIWRDLD